jgi:hypothetical protein
MTVTFCYCIADEVKVYYLGNPVPSQALQMTDARKQKLAQLPDLLYQLHVWSKDEQKAWFKTSHYNRYCLLNAQAEWISPPGDPILEIELVDQVTTSGGARAVAGGLFKTMEIEANRPSPFVFCHALQGAFFGSRADITGGEEYRQVISGGNRGYLYHDGSNRSYFVRTIDDPIFQQFRQFDGDMAARTLKDTYLQGAKNHQNIFSSWDALASKMIAIWRETAE